MFLLLKIAFLVNLFTLIILGILELKLPGFVLYFVNFNYLFVSFCVIGLLITFFFKKA